MNVLLREDILFSQRFVICTAIVYSNTRNYSKILYILIELKG